MNGMRTCYVPILRLKSIQFYNASRFIQPTDWKTSHTKNHIIENIILNFSVLDNLISHNRRYKQSPNPSFIYDVVGNDSIHTHSSQNKNNTCGTFVYFPGCNILKWQRRAAQWLVELMFKLGVYTPYMVFLRQTPLLNVCTQAPPPPFICVSVCGRSKACAVQTSKTDGIQSFWR